MKTVVALFDDVEHAQKAVHALTDDGFSPEDISLIAPGSEESRDMNIEIDEKTAKKRARKKEGTHAGEGAAKGAGIGAVLGALGGLVVGASSFVIPGIGSLIVAGPIATILGGAVTGAASGGIVGALIGAGIPKEDARIYAEGVRRGGTLVTVHTSADEARAAAKILGKHDPVDIEKRSDTWRSKGWQPEHAESVGVHEPMTTRPQSGDETRTGDWQSVSSGRVVGTYDLDYYRANQNEFHRHFQDNPPPQGGRYEDYEDAYRIGSELGSTRRDVGSWDAVEADARRRWTETHGESTWDRARDYMKYAWQKAKQGLSGSTGRGDQGYRHD